jgi:hypothetical protein
VYTRKPARRWNGPHTLVLMIPVVLGVGNQAPRRASRRPRKTRSTNSVLALVLALSMTLVGASTAQAATVAP